jgi:hypothetical protein
VSIPEGTKVRVKLESTISSATAEEGQIVEFTVAESVRLGDQIVLAEGARATGTVTLAQAKRRMGRAGKLDFSIDRVKAADNQWIALRYTVNRKSGQSHSVRTGVLTAGIAVAFWPAAPVMLLMKGKDVVVNKGVGFDVFTDNNYVLGSSAAVSQAASAAAQVALPSTQAGSVRAAGAATVTITSAVAGAEIEINGVFVGSTPTSLRMPAGQHKVAVKGNGRVWERILHVNADSEISLKATLN